MSSQKTVFIVRTKKNIWPFSILSKYQYQVTNEPVDTALQDIGSWKSVYKLYKTEAEAQEDVLHQWAIHNNPFVVLLYGIFFNSKVIEYRSKFANDWGTDFWNL